MLPQLDNNNNNERRGRPVDNTPAGVAAADAAASSSSPSSSTPIASTEETILNSQTSRNLLVQQFKSLVNKEAYHDVIFIVGQQKQKFYGHRIIMATRSEYFKKLFESKPHCHEFVIDNVQPREFAVLLEYIYTGHLCVTPNSPVPILTAAYQFGLDDIKTIFHEYIANHMDPQIACYLLEEAHKHKADRLYKRCFEFIEDHTTEAFESEFFLRLSSDLFAELLKSNKLSMREKNIFKSAVKWATAKAKEQKREVKDVFSEIAEYIRFPQMTALELRDEVEPTNLVSLELLLEAYRYNAIRSSKTDGREASNLRLTPRTGSRVWFCFDERRCATGIQLSNNCFTATNDTTTKSRTVLGSVDFIDGKHYWEVKINRSPAHSYIMVGVADTSTCDLNTFASHNPRGWCWYASDGTKYHSSSSRGYSTPFKVGDTVGVLLDLDEGTLTFYLNGESKSVAYNDLTGKLRAAVTLYSAGDEVTLDPLAKLPASK